MGASDADRQRRYRAHKAGDHSMCLPERECRADGRDVTPTVTSLVTRSRPQLSARGRRLWADMGGDKLTGGRRVLLEEACRITDRLDELHRLLRGDAEDWLGIVEDKGDPERQILVIDRLLAEARQQATALKQIVAELRQGAAIEGPEHGEGDVLDQLAARRAKRLADASGS